MTNKLGKLGQAVPPDERTCARYMYDDYGPESKSDVRKWCEWTTGNIKLNFPEDGRTVRKSEKNIGKLGTK